MRSARASGWRRQAAMASALPARMPACGPPSSLSPEKQTRSQPSRRASRASGSPASGGLVDQRTGADVVDQRERRAVGDLRERAHLDLAGEPEHAVVGGVHAQHGARLRPERLRVVGRARAVGRADLAQPRARALDDLGDAEAVADLDQLTARDDDLAPAGLRREREHERGGAVVDAERRLGAGQLADQRGDVILARAAPARREIELEIRVARGDRLHVRERGLGQRRPAEVRVQDDAGGVEHRAQRGLERGPHAASQLGREVGGGCLLAARAALGERGAGLAHAERMRGIAGRFAHEHVDRWQGACHAPIVRRRRAGEWFRQPAVHCPSGAGPGVCPRTGAPRPGQHYAGARIF